MRIARKHMMSFTILSDDVVAKLVMTKARSPVWKCIVLFTKLILALNWLDIKLSLNWFEKRGISIKKREHRAHLIRVSFFFVKLKPVFSVLECLIRLIHPYKKITTFTWHPFNFNHVISFKLQHMYTMTSCNLIRPIAQLSPAKHSICSKNMNRNKKRDQHFEEKLRFARPERRR